MRQMHKRFERAFSLKRRNIKWMFYLHHFSSPGTAIGPTSLCMDNIFQTK